MRTNAEVRAFRSEMIAAPTPTEQRLWEAMLQRWRGHSRRQRQAIIGPYIVDFLVDRKLLVVEVDGSIHESRTRYDAQRDQFLRRFGYSVMRIANEDVWSDPQSVLDRIAAFPDIEGTRRQRTKASQSARSQAAAAAQRIRRTRGIPVSRADQKRALAGA